MSCCKVAVAGDDPSPPGRSAHDADMLVYGTTLSGISAAASVAKGEYKDGLWSRPVGVPLPYGSKTAPATHPVCGIADPQREAVIAT